MALVVFLFLHFFFGSVLLLGNLKLMNFLPQLPKCWVINMSYHAQQVLFWLA